MSEYEEAAKEGFEKARFIYDGKTGGQKPKDESQYLKSTNKLHLDETRKELVFLGRTEDQQEWQPYIDSKHKALFIKAWQKGRRPDDDDESVLEMGQMLLAAGAYALNCSELACIAIAVAHKKLKELDPPHVGKASLSSPADHSFCVVALPDNLYKMHNTTVKDLKNKFTSSDDVWVADPWLNVRCQIASYPEMAQKKLDKWQRANKRILWKGGLGLGWYQPLGDYAKKFNDATIKFVDIC